MASMLTGIQSSGIIHIGNYFGSIKPSLEMCKNHDISYLMIADLHSLTTVKDAEVLKNNIFQLAATYLACGMNPEKTTLFRMSQVSAHAELAWILSCHTPMGMLERAHSYKDKQARGLETNVGLFTYPVLMACDILLYDVDKVPVGKDQKQHLEMTRDIAERFNFAYQKEVFKLPEPIISESTGVVPGIDGQKMSKSYGNTIPLFGEEKEIKKRVMQIVTDSTPLEDPKKPETCNVFTLCKLFLSNEELANLEDRYRSGGMGYGHAKTMLWEAMQKTFTPMWEKKRELDQKPDFIKSVLVEGTKKANAIAQKKLVEVFEIVGLK